jgi:hypothetical protein
MPTSILKPSQMTPDQVEAGPSDPLLQSPTHEDNGNIANRHYRHRFWTSLAFAAGLSLFLIAILGLGGKELTKRRFKWPGGPA